MSKLNTSQTIQQTSPSSRTRRERARIFWPHLIGLFAIEIVLVTLFVMLFAKASPAYALPGSLDAAQQPDGPNRLIPPHQGNSTTLTVTILSSPYATLDSNHPDGSAGEVPKVFIVQAAVQNTGTYTATSVEITLNYSDPANGWVLLAGEDPIRTIDELAPGAVYHAYWFARYPTVDGQSYQYTVTAEAANATLVSTSNNYYGNPAPNKTVLTRKALSTGNSGLVQSSSQIVVGVAFTITETYNLGTNPTQVIFSPAGNTDFDPSTYRLLASRTRFFNNSQAVVLSDNDHLYFPTLPGAVTGAEITYTFIALSPSNTRLCSYAAASVPSPRYDKDFCKTGYAVPITGTLSLSLTKQVDSVIVQQGQQLDYTITYTNNGNQTIQYAWIWDDLPAQVSVITSSINPANDPDETTEGHLAWDLGIIPPVGEPGSTGTLTFSVLVDGKGEDLPDNATLVNNAYFGINQGSLPNNPALTSTVTSLVQAPVISISKTDGQEAVGPNEDLSYTLRITNSGSIPATGLVLTDVLPSGVTLAGTATPGSYVQNGQTLVWNTLGPIPAEGGTLDVTIPVSVPLNATAGNLTNQATIAYENTAGYKFATKSASDVTTVQVPALSLTKSAEDVNGEPLVVNDIVQYTLQVANTGTYTAYNVLVTDDLPPQVTCQAVSGDHAPTSCDDPLIWTLPNLAPGVTASLNIDVVVNPGSEGQSFTNTAQVTSSNVFDPPDDPTPVCPDGGLPEPGTGECPSTPEPPDTNLIFTKTAEDLDGPPLVISDTVRYTLRVTNTGIYTAYNVVVTDTLPVSVTLISTQASQGYTSGTNPLVWYVGDVPASGGTGTLAITVTLDADTLGQSIVNTGQVSGDNIADPPADPRVCPDGSLPVNGVCETTPEEPSEAPEPRILLPIILKNAM